MTFTGTEYLPPSTLELKMGIHLSLGTESIHAPFALLQYKDHTLHGESIVPRFKQLMPPPRILAHVCTACSPPYFVLEPTDSR